MTTTSWWDASTGFKPDLPTATHFPFVNMLMGYDGSSQDILCRVIAGNDLTSLRPSVTIWNTEDVHGRFQSVFQRLQSDISLLKRVTNWQKNRLDYQAVHSAYLLGTMNEEEFLTEAEQFTSDVRTLPLEVIRDCVSRLQMTLDFGMGESDIADFLGVEVEDVSQAVLSLPSPPQHEFSILSIPAISTLE